MSTKYVGIRMDEDLLMQIKQRAEKEHRSLSNMIQNILIESTNQYSKGYDDGYSKGYGEKEREIQEDYGCI